MGNPAEGQQEVSTSKGPWKLLEASEPNLLSRPCWYLPMDFLYLSPGNLLNTLKGRTAVIQQNAEKRGTAWNVAVVKFMRASRGRQQRLGELTCNIKHSSPLSLTPRWCLCGQSHNSGAQALKTELTSDLPPTGGQIELAI